MRIAVAGGLVVLAGLSPVPAQPSAVQLTACVVMHTAALRLNQLDELIANCTRSINDRTATPPMRGEALGQRGLLYARRWSIAQSQQDASNGIADISEGLRLYTPTDARLHQLLLIRAQLHVGTGQTAKAVADYRAVLAIAPNDLAARLALRRLGEPEM